MGLALDVFIWLNLGCIIVCAWLALRRAGLIHPDKWPQPLIVLFVAAGYVTLPLWFLPGLAYWVYWRNKTATERSLARIHQIAPARRTKCLTEAETLRQEAKRLRNFNDYAGADYAEAEADSLDKLAVLWAEEKPPQKLPAAR
jgi:hypothetical protein